MKVNYIAIVAGILAFFILALPWWTMPMSGTFEMKVEDEKLAGPMSGDVSVYPYDARITIGLTLPILGEEIEEKLSDSLVDGFSIWYGYAALALIAITGVLAIVGSTTVGKKGKVILVIAGTLALLSIIIFAACLPGELGKLPKAIDEKTQFISGFPEVGLIDSGSFNSTTTMNEITNGVEITVDMSYSSNLSFGFWLALVVAIIAFISLLKHPTAPSKKKS